MEVKPRKDGFNTERFVYLLEYAKSGPLIHGFLIEAVQRYAKQCIDAGPEKFNNGLIDGESWVRCAKEAYETFALPYNSKDEDE